MAGIPQYKKDAVEKYLDQVKILTALATALLITPSLVEFATKKQLTPLEVWLLIVADGLFLAAIVLTYFVYSPIVGGMIHKQYDIRSAQGCSIAQFVCLCVGCILLLLLFLLVFLGDSKPAPNPIILRYLPV